MHTAIHTARTKEESKSMFRKRITENLFKQRANEERLGNKKNKLSESTFLKPMKRIRDYKRRY